MSILKKLKQAVSKEVIGSTLKSSVAPVTGKKSKLAIAVIAAAAAATAVADYL